MVDMTESNGGVLLPVQAQPGARQNGVIGEHDGRLKVAVTTAAEKGKANKHLIKVIAAELGLKRSQVTLHSGERSARKIFLLSGITTAEVRQRIAATS